MMPRRRDEELMMSEERGVFFMTGDFKRGG
jgi:hypothetical protein